MTEETFGPVLPIVVVDSEEQAIKWANDSEYGLSASVWSSNTYRAKAIAGKLNAGTVFINDALFSHAVPELPWGGIRKSGFGRSHSYFGLLDLVNIKHVSVDKPSRHRLWWYPYGPGKIQLVTGGLQMFHARSYLKRAEGLYQFLARIAKKS